MRTRSRTRIVSSGNSYPSAWHQVNTTTGQVIQSTDPNNAPGGVIEIYETSSISDNRSRPAAGFPPTVKPCSHQKVLYNCNGKGVITYSYTSGGWIYTRKVSGGPSHVACDTMLGGSLASLAVTGVAGVPAPINWVALESAFYEKCNQYVPTAVLGGESLAESSIYKEAILLALNPSRSVKVFVKALVPLMKKFVRPSLKDAHDIAKAAGSSFLSYNFGVKPAINDIKACLSAHSVVKARLAYLSKNKGTFVPIRSRTMNSSPRSGIPDVAQTFARLHACYNGEAVRTGTISAYGRVRNDLNNRGSWRAYADYFGGLQTVVGLAWELIPFSFVVDWVTNAQERIRNLKHLTLGGPFSEISSMCCSEKLVQRFELVVNDGYWIPGSNFHTVGIDDTIQVGEGFVTSYNRTLTIPDDTAPLDFSGLGIFHLLASGSLILQRT